MKTLYQDGLIEITDQEMVFHHYYFPFGGDKRVPLAQVESVQTRPPSILNGKWRIWGSGDLLGRTWFPMDGARPSRDLIFIAALRGRRNRIGFTVEHSQEVIAVLKELGLLNESRPDSSRVSPEEDLTK